MRLRFRVSRLDGAHAVRFCTKLDGAGGEWTPYFDDPVWQSGILNEGHYTLRAMAQDEDGVESREYRWAFAILPPWYRTPWMYGGCLAAAALAEAGWVRWRLSTLNGILGYAQLLKRQPEWRDAHGHRAESIADSGHHLLGMINELLDLAGIEAGKLGVTFQPVEFCALFWNPWPRNSGCAQPPPAWSFGAGWIPRCPRGLRPTRPGCA
ncbi:MAG TPA: histidine kinase dimerization/phospho-acceptor domain-containing protein, partial [Chthoniobacterales bacterium]